MGKRLERFDEVRIIDETNGFGLGFVEKTESRFWSTTPDVGAVIASKMILDVFLCILAYWKNFSGSSLCYSAMINLAIPR